MTTTALCERCSRVGFFWALAYVLLSGYVMALAQLWSDHRADYDVQITFHDVLFDIFPLVEYCQLPNVLVWTSIVIFIARFALGPIREQRGDRLAIFRRVFLGAAFLYNLRTLSISLTTFPSPSVLHKPRYLPDNVFLGALCILVGTEATSTDLIFSGHTVMWTLLTWHWCHYTPKHGAWQWSSYAFGIFNAIGVASLFATRFHYSVDVFLALILTSAQFLVYYHWIASDTTHNDDDKCLDSPAIRWLRHFDHGCTHTDRPKRGVTNSPHCSSGNDVIRLRHSREASFIIPLTPGE
jgi:hypothetical protein